MPIDSVSSSPSSRRTIIVRFAHGHARATTSRYRPASAGSVPSRPSAVIRPFRSLVSRTNSPVAPPLPTLPHCFPFQIPPPPRLADALPEGALVAGRVVGRGDGVAQQGSGAPLHVVARPAGVAAGDEVHPYPVSPVRDDRRRRVAD